MNAQSIRTAIFLLGLSLGTVQSQEEQNAEEESEDSQDEAIVLPIEVTTEVVPAGKHVYSETVIENTPVGHRHLSDLLKINPAVDFSRNAGLSAGTASLRPAEISVHGQPYYQNLFLLDGVDTTSDLNPGSSEDIFAIPSLVQPIGGSSPQGYYVDTSLLKVVEVYDSNVPAKHGGFTGGVVSAELKEYDGNNKISVQWGHKRDQWEEFHLTEDDITTADKYRGVYTPDYEKNDYGITIVRGLGENLGVSFGISRRTSTFLQEYEDDTDTINKIYYDDEIDNLVGRIDFQVGDTPYGISIRHSNRANDGLTSTTYTGGFVREHSASGVSLSIKPGAYEGRLSLSLSYDNMGDSMDSESSYFVYHEYLENSGISRYSGAFGDMEQKQSRFSFKPELAFEERILNGLSHKFTMGGEARQTTSYYERPETITYEQYYCVRDDGSNGCRDQDGDGASSAGDEYLNRRFFYQAGKVEIDYREVAVFVEDYIELNESVGLRLALRGDWGSFLDNFDISPRMVLYWSPNQLDDATLSVGLNRYYGRSFLRYELNDAIYGWRESYLRLTRPRGRPGEEVPCSIPVFENCTHLFYDNRTGASELDTPYSDEIALGWTQPLLGMNTTTQIVQRMSKDGVSRERRADRLYYYGNDGESTSRSITLSLDLVEPLRVGPTETNVFFGFSYSESESNFQSDDGYDSDIERDLIYYKDSLIDPSDLPAWDYNIPFGIRGHTITEFGDIGLVWMNFINVRAGGTIARDSRQDYTDPSTGTRYDIYEDFDFDNQITIDSNIKWTLSTFDAVEPYVTMSIRNLFDDISDQSLVSTRKRYTAGRRFDVLVGVTF